MQNRSPYESHTRRHAPLSLRRNCPRTPFVRALARFAFFVVVGAVAVGGVWGTEEFVWSGGGGDDAWTNTANWQAQAAATDDVSPTKLVNSAVTTDAGSTPGLDGAATPTLTLPTTVNLTGDLQITTAGTGSAGLAFGNEYFGFSFVGAGSE